ncbi:MAG: lipid A deacylase LpxR family protein [Longimicrobiaceae bacterium]
MKFRLRHYSVLFLPLLLLCRPAGAQARLVVENDLFAPHPLDQKAQDRDYTAGTRLSWTSSSSGWWAKPLGVGDSARLATRWELGQEIYTPRIDAAVLPPGERPYAGWLYGAMTAEATKGARTRSLTLQLGVTGPPSLAEPVQKEIHRIGGFEKPLGWNSQLPFEPGVVARYGESWVLARDLGGTVAEAGPEWEVALGNVLTGARAGLHGRIAHRGVYASAAVREDWVGRNLFLDGSTFQDGPRVEKLAFVPQAEVGVGARIGWLGIGYRTVYRGREYRTQRKAHAWGSISLEIHPR